MISKPTDHPPLRVVLLYSSGHLGSATLFNMMTQMPELQIIGVVRAEAAQFNRAGRKKIVKQMKKIGWRFGWLLLWQRVIQAVGFGLSWLLRRKGLRPGWTLARELNIPVLQCANINDQSSRQWIADRKPDLLVSAFFTQILKAPVIELPRLGVLNVHPGHLPSYRGAMVYFWVLKNGDDHAGVTVHWIDEGIDTGQIVARRRILIRPGATQQRIMVRTAVVGAHLLRRVMRKLLFGQSPDPIAINQVEAAYWPMPGQEDFDSYFARHRFFRIRDVLGLFTTRRRK